MMKKIMLALVLVSGTLLFSCKSGGGDPKSVLAEFFTALSKKDMAKARTFATEDSKSMLDMMEMGMNMTKDDKETAKYSENNLTYGEVKIDGDKATVPVTEKTSGETMNYTLKKEKGTWKVAFDKQSVMSMGMEKMNEQGINPTDSIDAAMDELKNMDQDSIKAAINEGLKMIDSAKEANP